MRIEIYGQENCKYCRDAIVFCRVRKIPYSYYGIGTEVTAKEFKELFPDEKTVPQIKINGKHIGGYTQLEHYIL